MVREAKTKYTVYDFPVFLEEVKDICNLEIQQVFERTCEIVCAIPQNLLAWFKTKLLQSKSQIDSSVFQWVDCTIYKRMVALGLIPDPYKT